MADSENTTPQAEATEGKMTIDREKYQTARTASGTKSLNNGDAVAKALEGLTLDEVYALTKSITGTDFREKYSHLNPGQQRMNLGNRLRGKVRQINADNDKAAAAAKADNKPVPQAKTGEMVLAEAAKPHREAAAKREAEKEAEAKRKAEERAKKQAEAKPEADKAAAQK